MKALNELNRRQILDPGPLPNRNSGQHPLSLQQSFRSKLRAVSAREMPSQPDSKAVDGPIHERVARYPQTISCSAGTNRMSSAVFNDKVRLITVPMLTTEEFIQVKLATVRESTRHCFWPTDVVAKFAAADVIRSYSAPPRRLSGASQG